MMKSILDELRPERRPKMGQKFDIKGTVHKEFVPPKQTMNGKFYCEFLGRLRSKYPVQSSREVAQLLGPAS
jgi:hypothetical protein